MIKLTGIELKADTRLLLRFSDGAWGVYDFSPLIAARTEMTAPLGDPEFLGCCFIELGALAWPNGFELSAESLYRTLRLQGMLRRGVDAA